MGSIGCALAYGPNNDLGVTGVGFDLADLVDDLHSSLYAHPAYPSLFDRSDVYISGAERAMDDFFSLHDALEAMDGRDIDPALAATIVDLADRAQTAAGTSGIDSLGRKLRAADRRCMVMLVVSMTSTGCAIVCGRGPRLGAAFASAVSSLQSHPLLPAFSEHRSPTLVELEAFATWRDPLIADLFVETEID